jgi:hypothetical protein
MIRLVRTMTKVALIVAATTVGIGPIVAGERRVEWI